MNNDNMSDETLVSRVLNGEGEAYSTLISRYTNTLSSIAFLKVRNVEDVRDIVQEAFVSAYCNLSQLDDPTKFGAWIRRIVINHCCKTLEKRTRTKYLIDRHAPITNASDPVTELVGKDSINQMLSALSSLNELHHEVIILYYFQDMRVDEIAHLVNRPGGTIKRMLSEARSILRKELMNMAREEFKEYYLNEEQRKRLDMIPAFPQVEPKISATHLNEAAQQIKISAPYGTFPAIHVGSEAHYADYDYPDRKLKTINHARVEGPFDIGGVQALRYDDLSFTEDGKAEWIWRPYYHVDDDTISYCAVQFGDPNSILPVLTPDQSEWGEQQPQTQSMYIIPGYIKEPDGDIDGFTVDTMLWKVHIGKKTFKCIRRLGGGGRQPVEWSDIPVTRCATEEFFLMDGRLLLWRRYNGFQWSERQPGKNNDAPGTYECLADAGAPMLELFGEKYYLWYDQIPDYAIR